MQSFKSYSIGYYQEWEISKEVITAPSKQITKYIETGVSQDIMITLETQDYRELPP